MDIISFGHLSFILRIENVLGQIRAIQEISWKQ